MEREASVKLTLDNGQFIVNIKRAGDAVDETGTKAKKSASAWSAGMSGAKESVGALGGKVKEVIGLAAGLGAAFSLGDAVHHAISAREKFRDIEFQINKTGKTVDGATANWESLQGAARDAGRETGQSVNNMGAAMEKLFAATGDADYSVGALEMIGHAASATGKSVDSMANVAQVLQRKFGATLETLPEMMAVFVQKTDAGGLSLEAMGNKFALMAGEAQEAGFKGRDGLAQLLGIMETLDSRVGEKSEPAMKKLFMLFKDGSKDLKALSKESGIKFEADTTGIEKFRKMLGSDKGRKVLQEKLGGEARVVYDELSKPFEAAFDEAKKTGAKTKDATDAGLRAWDESIKQMGKSTIDYARLVKDSKEGQAEDPAKRLEMALEDFREAIATPEMFEAIDSLAKSLPKLAKMVSGLVGFAVNNPLLAGGLAVGGMGAGGFVKEAAKTVTVNFAKGTQERAVSMMKPAGKALAEAAAAHPGWTKAGKALGVAAAALVGFEIGKALVDSRIESKEKAQKDIVGAGADAHAATLSGDKSRMKDARAALKDKIAQMEDDQSGASGAFDDLMGGLVTIMPGGDPNFVSPERKMLMNAKRDLARLEQGIAAPDVASAKRSADAAATSEQKKPGLAPTGLQRTTKVKMEDSDEHARAIARYMAGQTLKVELAESRNGSRGPLTPPPPGT